MFLKEVLEVISQMIAGIVDLVITLKPGIAAIWAHPFVAAASKALGIILGIPAAIYFIAKLIKRKIFK